MRFTWQSVPSMRICLAAHPALIGSYTFLHPMAQTGEEPGGRQGLVKAGIRGEPLICTYSLPYAGLDNLFYPMQVPHNCSVERG